MTVSDGEVRIWLMDTECELRPIMAADLLLARKKAREQEAVYGADEAAKRMLTGAYTAALGIYSEGERLFSDGKEVLENLTAQEIMTVLKEYEESGEAAAKPEGNTGKPEESKGLLTEKIKEASVVFGEEREHVLKEPEEILVPKEKEEHTENKEPLKNAGKPTGGFRTVQTSGFKREAAEPEEESFFPALRSVGKRDPYAEISDYFEKDSRRYDGAFAVY